MKIPEGLTCKNTFFDMPAMDEPVHHDLGPATCPPPTEGWWSSPSPSRPSCRSESSPAPGMEDIGPTPDWFATPQVPPQLPSAASTGSSAKAPGSMSRFDRLLLEATNDDNDGDNDEPATHKAQVLPSSVGLPSMSFDPGLAFGGAGGLDTPWEDTPHFAPPHSGYSAPIPPPPPGMAPGPGRPAHAAPSRFDMLLMEANMDESTEGSRRSSVNSNRATPFADTPWEPGWSAPTMGTGLDTPWEDAPHYAAAHGFGQAGLRPPLIAPGGPLPSYGGPALAPLPSLGDGLAAAAARRPPLADFGAYSMGEPARLPLSSLDCQLEPHLPSTGPLLSVPPPALASRPMGLPAPGRVIVDLARELGFQPSMAGMGFAPPPGMPPVAMSPAPGSAVGASAPVAKARRRRGSKEAKQPDRAKDPTWWLPTATYIDLGAMVKVPKMPLAAAIA